MRRHDDDGQSDDDGSARGAINPAEFIRANLPLAPAPGVPEVRLHQAAPSSGLWRLAEADPAGFSSPYWAYPWAGGLALARYLLERREIAQGRRALDLGAGGGVVAIAAALAGAQEVLAADIDPYALAALRLNVEANGVNVSGMLADLTKGPAPEIDLILAGDVFYEQGLADRMTTFLDRCLGAGIEVLVGDPGRAFLPGERLEPLAEYPTPDFGEIGRGQVFRLSSARAPAG
jgi:predicted nicotinamide N-methyase